MKTRVDGTPAIDLRRVAFKILGAIGFFHFLNDMLQSLILAIYPLLKDTFSLNFTLGHAGLVAGRRLVPHQAVPRGEAGKKSQTCPRGNPEKYSLFFCLDKFPDSLYINSYKMKAIK